MAWTLLIVVPLLDCAWQRIFVWRWMGLQGRYYPHDTGQGALPLTTVDTDISSTTLAARRREVPGGISRVEWTGHLDIPASDAYRLFAETDGNLSVSLDGAPVLESRAGGASAEASGAASLRAGPHAIVIRYVPIGEKPRLVLSWARRNQLREPLAADSLLPPSPSWPALRLYDAGRGVLRWLFVACGLAAVGATAVAGVLYVLDALSRQRRRLAAVGCLALLAVSGAAMLDDYGVSLDESIQRQIGIANYQYLAHGAKRLVDEDFPERHYGPVFELLLVCVEEQLGLSDSRDIFLVRHALTFALFSLSVVFFYLLCLRQTGSAGMAILGACFLVLSPRIFADAFYNSKDVPFLSVFVVGIYTLVRFLDQPSNRRAFWHALCSAVLIDIRVVGLLIPAMTAFFALGELLVAGGRGGSRRQRVLALLSYVGLTACFTVAFFPFLWESPAGRFADVLAKMSQFPFTRTVLYLGQDLPARMLPWHYAPVWIGVTTPVGYLGLFGAGLLVIGASALARPAELLGPTGTRENLIWALWSLLPLVSVVATGAVIYDGWRHLFFLYPGLVMVAVSGLSWVWGWIRRALRPRTARYAQGALVLWVVASLAEPLRFMVENHPHEYVFFNRLAGEDMDAVKRRFELDYWGLSYRQGLEWVLRHDGREAIKVFLARGLPEASAAILPRDERGRLVFAGRRKEAEYFLGNYRWHRGDYPYRQKVYAARVGDAEIMTVYDLRYERWTE